MYNLEEALFFTTSSITLMNKVTEVTTSETGEDAIPQEVFKRFLKRRTFE